MIVHLLIENVINYIFTKFQSLYDNLVQVFTNEQNRIKINLLQTQEEKEKLYISVKESENMRFEAEQLKENMSREAESLKRQYEYQLLSKDYNEESLKNTIESKEKLLKKKKEQKKNQKLLLIIKKN